MLKVGNRGPIKEVLHDLEHLHRYLQDWKPKHTAKWSKEDLISQMSIVQVSERHYMQDGDTPEERKQIARARYEREAPRKAYRQEIRRQKEAKKNRSN